MRGTIERFLFAVALIAAPLIGFFGVVYLTEPPVQGLVNVALNKPTSQSSVYAEFNASGPGGVDGIKDGGFGFHTNNDDLPWWMVDLGRVYSLRKIVVYNTVKCCTDRSRNLEILGSTGDGGFRPLYRRNGREFGGVSAGQPLNITLNGEKARYIRLQLPEKVWLHMDEVEVYAYPDE